MGASCHEKDGGKSAEIFCVIRRVCEEMLRRHLFPPGPDSLALMCGPPGMQVTHLAPHLTSPHV